MGNPFAVNFNTEELRQRYLSINSPQVNNINAVKGQPLEYQSGEGIDYSAKYNPPNITGGTTINGLGGANDANLLKPYFA